MNEETTNKTNNSNFFSYYYPTIFLIIASLGLMIGVYLTNGPNQSFVIFIIMGFAAYRSFTSRWAPKVMDREKAYQRAWDKYAEGEMQNRAMNIVTHNFSPGRFTKIRIWIESSYFSIIVMVIVWAPMELFIQSKFLVNAISESKTGNILPTRRGPWPGKERETNED